MFVCAAKIKGSGQFSTNAFKQGFSGPPSTYNLYTSSLPSASSCTAARCSPIGFGCVCCDAMSCGGGGGGWLCRRMNWHGLLHAAVLAWWCGSAPKLSQARRVHSDTVEAEHHARREHMYRRISEYPNRKDREQNPMDPVAHPVLLIRPADTPTAALSASASASAPPTAMHATHGPGAGAFGSGSSQKRVYYANPFDSSDMRPIASSFTPASASGGVGRMARSPSATSPLKGGPVSLSVSR